MRCSGKKCMQHVLQKSLHHMPLVPVVWCLGCRHNVLRIHRLFSPPVSINIRLRKLCFLLPLSRSQICHGSVLVSRPSKTWEEIPRAESHVLLSRYPLVNNSELEAKLSNNMQPSKRIDWLFRYRHSPAQTTRKHKHIQFYRLLYAKVQSESKYVSALNKSRVSISLHFFKCKSTKFFFSGTLTFPHICQLPAPHRILN